VAHLFDKLPQKISYIREYALKYGRDTKEETSKLIDNTADRRELEELTSLEISILKEDHLHLNILMNFIEDNLEKNREEAIRLNSSIWAIMAVPGS
jgi:hypothetical protein